MAIAPIHKRVGHHCIGGEVKHLNNQQTLGDRNPIPPYFEK